MNKPLSSAALAPIRVAPGGRYFETFDEKPFLFLGANEAIAWQGLSGLYRRRDMAGVEAHLESMAASGITILRLMLEYSETTGYYFEQPAGTFNPALIQMWDDLFPRCERFGLRILLAPWDNFWMALKWKDHPYNQANGGPAAAPGSFFTDPIVIEATIRRIRFVIERWGKCSALAAWDLFNEIDPHWGGTPAQQAQTLTQISDAVREAELKHCGYTRPQTVSIYGPDPQGDYEDLIFRHPSLDFATTHIYYKGAIDYPLDTVEPAAALAGWVKHALERTPSSRPYTDTEHGPIHLFNDHKRMHPEEFDDEYERHIMWAHLASGGAGGGMRWPARHPHMVTKGMRQALSCLAAFTQRIAWRYFTPVNISADIRVGIEDVLAFGCRDEWQAVVWLLRGKRYWNPQGILPLREPLLQVPVTVPGLSPGVYRIELWDTKAGCVMGCLPASVTEDRMLRIVLPALGNDLALAIRPGEPAAQWSQQAE